MYHNSLKYSAQPGSQCVRPGACPDGRECIFEDKSYKEVFRYLLRNTALLGALLNLVLPCTPCKLFVQKYRKAWLDV